jgi:NAD+ kinase
MRIAVYIGKEEAAGCSRVQEMLARLEDSGVSLYPVAGGQSIEPGTDLLMSVGGDGTFLTASILVAQLGIPVVGVNLGRLGFLSENRPEDLGEALLAGDYSVEERAMLRAVLKDEAQKESYALNEITVHRSGAAMLAVDVDIDGVTLPTYWADGLIVSTSSGSTAYSLSAGGPIVLPDAKVLIVTPIAPHNLNVRPLVVPDNAQISLKVSSRDANVALTADNRGVLVEEGAVVNISLARFSLKRVRLNKADFINALTEKLHWGEDVRNINRTK